MYRQQQQQNVPNGRGYPSEVAGRDRVKFFRRAVEPDNTVLDAHAALPQAQLAASCPSFTLPSSAAVFAETSPVPAVHFRSGGAARYGGPRRPSSSSCSASPADYPSRQPHNAHGSTGNGGRGYGGARGGMPRRAGGATRPPPRLPSLNAERHSIASTSALAHPDGRVTMGVQTLQRDNEAQTDPYSPDYVLQKGAATPEVLSLQSLTYQNGGLPAGRQEVQLIQRLRRRREVQAALPTGTDAASVEARYTVLHELEEREWAEREAHVEQLQERRLDRMKASLLAREAAREGANRDRLEQIKAQYLETLEGRLTTLEKQRAAASRRGLENQHALRSSRLNGTASISAAAASRSHASIANYSRYGMSATPPPPTSTPATVAASDASADGAGLDVQFRQARQAFNYDIRPQLLTEPRGADLVDAERGAKLDRVAPRTFVVPENEAVERLPTLYQRRDAERVLRSLEYADKKIAATKSGDGHSGEESKEAQIQRLLDTYRAPPRVQRPATPVLELDGDDEEEEEDACMLLQRLLRGRAVQNDFFEGRERCRGLIEELQAASTAKTAETRGAAEAQQQAQAAAREAEADALLDAALGAVAFDTLNFLTQELGRQQDMATLRALHAEAESVRQSREATERARRAEVRQQRDRNEVAYAAFMRATSTSVQCFLEDVVQTAAEETAMSVAVAEEAARQAAQPSPREPATAEEAEAMVCDMMDGFVLPTIAEAIQLQQRELEKKAVACVAVDVAHAACDGEGEADDEHDDKTRR